MLGLAGPMITCPCHALFAIHRDPRGSWCYRGPHIRKSSICESSNSDTALQTGEANSYTEESVLPPGRKGSGGTDVPAVGWLVLQMVPNQGMMSLAGRLSVQQWW